MSSSIYLNSNSNGNVLPPPEKNSELTTPETSNTNNLAIPMNKGSKLYPLDEMFEVWDNNRDTIMSTKLNPHGQTYKVSEPNQIYHFDLHQNPDLQKLSLEDPNPDPNGNSAPEAPHNGNSLLPEKSSNGVDLSNSNPSFQDHQSHQQPSVSNLISPEEIQWYYLDSTGSEQGPFNGDLMQGWFSDGYLHLNLMIKRKEEPNFQPLRNLCESLTNFVSPFKVPLPPVRSQAPPRQSPPQLAHLQTQMPLQSSSIPQSYHPLLNSSVSFGNQPLFDSSLNNSGSFGQSPYQAFPNSMPSLLQQQIHQQHQPVLSRTNSNWGLDGYSNPSTPLSVNPVINQVINQSQPQVSQPAPISPWASAVHSSSRVNSPFVPPVESANDNVLSDFSSSVVTGILDDDDKPPSFTQPVSAATSIPEKPVSDYKIASEPVELPKPVPEVAPVKNVKQAPKEVPVAAPVYTEVPVKEPEFEPAQVPPPAPAPEPKVETQKATKAAIDNKAPWAVSSAESVPAMSLKEIQRLESEKLQKQKQLEIELRAEQQLKLLQEEKALEKARELNERSGLPSTSSWATSFTKPAKVTKTLAEIQREEKEAAELAKRANAAAVSASIADTLAYSPAVEETGWTTITGKKPAPVKKQVSAASVISTGNTKISPQVLRSVSASTVSVVDNSSGLREEFLIWARSQMTNLYPSVSQNDLLEMFISLPSNADSQQLILETIHSSSTTMNGRRFAQEFLKRRQKVDQQIGRSDPAAWSSAIVHSADKVADVDEDGWSTSTKGKKRGNKKF